MKIILASASPRRKELLGLITKDFEVITAEVDERKIEEEVIKSEADSDFKTKASDLTVCLAEAKAKAVYEMLSKEDKEETLVIGADTCVVTDGEILGKPEDEEDARRMLLNLSGMTHSVITGVSIITRDKKISFAEESLVTFNDDDAYQRALIEKYVQTKDPYDKAGAYGIQSGGALLVKKIEGDYFNIVGLPVCSLARNLCEVW